jgi:uncharacterized membrane protein YhaH (DUF805 family)
VTLSEYLFSPRGRMNRAKYWIYVVVSIAIIVVLIAVMGIAWAGRLYDPRGGFVFRWEQASPSGSSIWSC